MKNKFIKICKKLAEYSDHHQHKMAALIIKKNKLLSLGYNQLKTHPKSPHFFRSTHAEFACIKQLSLEQLRGSTILVYREQRDGTLANARPCESCLKLIIQSGIKKIVFTNENRLETICLKI